MEYRLIINKTGRRNPLVISCGSKSEMQEMFEKARKEYRINSVSFEDYAIYCFVSPKTEEGKDVDIRWV